MKSVASGWHGWTRILGLQAALVAGTAVWVGPALGAVETGAYTGSGAGQTIAVGFAPDLLIVKADHAIEAVGRSRTMSGDVSKTMQCNPGRCGFTGARITELTTGGFSVGDDLQVNAAGIVYHWIAFRAAPGELSVGSYVGNGTGQALDAGLEVEWLWLLPEDSQQVLQSFRAQEPPLTMTFGDLASFSGGVVSLSTPTTGFTIGSDPRVNTSGVRYHFAAWAASPGKLVTGSYTGDGTDDRIISIGWQPEVIFVKGEAETARYHPGSLGYLVDASLSMSAIRAYPNVIQSLEPTTFTVGSDSRVNAPSVSYQWVAIGNGSPTLDGGGAPPAVQPDPELGASRHLRVSCEGSVGGPSWLCWLPWLLGRHARPRNLRAGE